MLRRSTIVILVLFALLLALAWYLQSNDSSESVEGLSTSTPMANLFEFSGEELIKIQITDSEGNLLTMEKDTSGEWMLVEPSGYQTDQDKANDLINDILSLQVLTQLESQLSSDIIGLESPSHQIRLETGSGEIQTAFVGITTPTDSGYYVKIGGRTPVIISKTSIDGVLDYFTNPPVVLTPTPTTVPQAIETQIPEFTPTR